MFTLYNYPSTIILCIWMYRGDVAWENCYPWSWLLFSRLKLPFMQLRHHNDIPVLFMIVIKVHSYNDTFQLRIKRPVLLDSNWQRVHKMSSQHIGVRVPCQRQVAFFMVIRRKSLPLLFFPGTSFILGILKSGKSGIWPLFKLSSLPTAPDRRYMFW